MRPIPPAVLLLSLVFWPVNGRAYEVAKVAGGGSIEGTARFRGAPPKPKRILITQHQDTCGQGERVIEEVGVSKSGGLKNVVVYIEGIPTGKDWEKLSEDPLVDQKDCRFLPTLLIFPKGKTLTISNSDPVAHNIHAYELSGRTRSTLFNIAQPTPGRLSKDVKLRKTDTIKVECDVHNFMHGWMFAAETPYYALSDEEGRFSIAEVPPGKYKIKAWHPVLGVKEADVTVAAGKPRAVSFEWSAKP